MSINRKRLPSVGELWGRKGCETWYTVTRVDYADVADIGLCDVDGQACYWRGPWSEWLEHFERGSGEAEPQMPALPGWTCERDEANRTWEYALRLSDSAHYVYVDDTDVTTHGREVAIARSFAIALASKSEQLRASEKARANPIMSTRPSDAAAKAGFRALIKQRGWSQDGWRFERDEACMSLIAINGRARIGFHIRDDAWFDVAGNAYPYCESAPYASRIAHIPEAKRNRVACQGDWLDTWEGEDA